jgi:hypothetical protein
MAVESREGTPVTGHVGEEERPAAVDLSVIAVHKPPDLVY